LLLQVLRQLEGACDPHRDLAVEILGNLSKLRDYDLAHVGRSDQTLECNRMNLSTVRATGVATAINLGQSLLRMNAYYPKHSSEIYTRQSPLGHRAEQRGVHCGFAPQ
jgi:hypothetical protein